MKAERAGNARRFRGMAIPLLLLVCALRAQAQSLELGAGAKIDIAPYGIENVTALAFAAPWFDLSQGLQAGMVAAGSAGMGKVDMEISACFRVWPERTALALFDGVGALVENDLWPAIVPIILGGLRIGAGANAIVACVEVHYKRTDSDTMVWLALARRL
jgi:hypothetical protein